MIEAKKVLVTGSAGLSERYIDLVREFGRRLMKETDFILITGGLESKGHGDLLSVDCLVANAAYDALDRSHEIAQSRIMTILPDIENTGYPRFAIGKVVRIPRLQLRARRYLMVLTSDAVVAFNGSKATKENINLAYVAGKTLIPLPSTNGAAREIWNEYNSELIERLNLSDEDLDGLQNENNSTNVITTCLKVLSRNLRPTCFVAMPFTDHPLPEAFDVIHSVVEKNGYQAIRVDRELFHGDIIEAIWNAIQHCDVLIADCTQSNPNVFYELGIGHALRKPTLMVVYSKEGTTPDSIPFDVRVKRIFPFGSLQSLRSILEDFFQNRTPKTHTVDS